AEVSARPGMEATVDGSSCKEKVRPSHLSVEACSPGALEAQLERLAFAARELDRADRRQGVDGGLGVVEALRKLERAAGPRRCFFGERCSRAGVREVAVRHGELAPRRKALEQGDRLTRQALGLRGPAGTPDDLRVPAQRVALLESVTERSVALEGLLDHLDRRVELVGDEELVEAAVEEFGALGRRQPVAE